MQPFLSVVLDIKDNYFSEWPKILLLVHEFVIRTTNQQVHWVVQVIPYVSKGRSHGDYWFEASYVYFIILSQDINYNYQFELLEK